MTAIACVIPAYNEAQFIEEVIAGIPAGVQHVIVVNDASTDDTEEVLRRIADPRLIVIDHPQNQGVGGAMASGYRRALELGAEILRSSAGRADSWRTTDLSTANS